MPTTKKNHSEEHKAKIAEKKARSSSKTSDILSGCIASQLREDHKGKISYMKINGKGPITPVADMETLCRMVRLLQKDGAAELFQERTLIPVRGRCHRRTQQRLLPHFCR